ncbi:hypothetical protein E2C01_095166 [Portunus trituberculatus]|uniref:Uncharacterized protein n=1 Tax=Portunus trituberculatus TaxID=210409 RepID=A0A5B7JYS5_PORTR|nr:hypothetical protein [Portunus trituberculatus]
MAALPSLLSLKLNSSLKPLLTTPLWMTLGLSLPQLLPLTFLCNDVFHALAGLIPWKAYGPDEVPPIVLKNCASVLPPCLAKLFQECQLTSTFPFCWKFAYI